MKYKAIYADPPWYFRNFSAKGTGRAPISHYDVLTLEELKALPVADYADKNCALFLWVTDPMLPEGIELMRAWGFKFKTIAFHWVKLNKNAASKKVEDDPFFTGLGYWTRANPELCLLGTRGSPRRISKDVRRLLVSERREHSRKPDEIYDRIERLVDGPYLELFARKRRKGWDASGKELKKKARDKYVRRQPSKITADDEIDPKVVSIYSRQPQTALVKSHLRSDDSKATNYRERLFEEAQARRQACKTWLAQFMRPGQPKPLTKDELFRLAQKELGVSRANFNAAWILAIEEHGRQDWYSPRRSSAARNQ